MELIPVTKAARSLGELTDRCLTGETFRFTRRGRALVELSSVRDQPSLAGLSDQIVVSLSLWLMLDYTPTPKDLESVRLLRAEIANQGIARGWPEGWWEDPSLIPSIAATLRERANRQGGTS